MIVVPIVLGIVIVIVIIAVITCTVLLCRSMRKTYSDHKMRKCKTLTYESLNNFHRSTNPEGKRLMFLYYSYVTEAIYYIYTSSCACTMKKL